MAKVKEAMKEATKKRAKTIEVNKKILAKKQARRDRRRKFNQFTSKPVVWVFALVGWGHAIYYLFQLVVIVLQALGYM